MNVHTSIQKYFPITKISDSTSKNDHFKVEQNTKMYCGELKLRKKFHKSYELNAANTKVRQRCTCHNNNMHNIVKTAATKTTTKIAKIIHGIHMYIHIYVHAQIFTGPPWCGRSDGRLKAAD